MTNIVIDSYSETNQDAESTEQALYETVGSTNAGHGQSFSCSIYAVLRKITLYLKKTGGPQGHLRAFLFADSGIYGSSSVPTGAALASSELFDISTLTTNFALIDLIFNDSYVMKPGTKYHLTFGVVDASVLDASNDVRSGRDNSSPSHGGNSSYWNANAWTAFPPADRCFYVYGDAVNTARNNSPQLISVAMI